MRRVNKKTKIEFIGVTVLITVSYPKKLTIPQFKLPYSSLEKLGLIALPLLFLIFSLLQFKEFLNNNPTRTMPSVLNSDVYFSVTSKYPQKSFPTSDRVVFNGPRDKKQVALTFDADMTPEMMSNLNNGFVKSYYDQDLINFLISSKTKATLFLSGMWIQKYYNESQELDANPLFELANHSYSHPGFDGECYGLVPLLDLGNDKELQITQILLKSVMGIDNKLFRFPGGCYSKTDQQSVFKNKMVAIGWDDPGQDGFNPDADSIVSNVLNNVQNGSIIVLHMNGYPNEPATTYALPIIITSLKENGYKFVKVSELLEFEQEEISFIDKHFNYLLK